MPSGRVRSAMTPEQLKEEVSKAYVHAVAARCGVAVANWTQDHGCLDTTLRAAAAIGGGHLQKPKVDIQLKATTRTDVEHEDHIAWSLEIGHYDQLRATALVPHLLVILLLPPNLEDSVQHTAEQLVLRRCAYWVTMTGMETAPEGQKSRTVHVPKSQPFSPDGLREILSTVSRGELP